MFGRLLNSVTWQVRNELKRKLKSNADHRDLSWNCFEKVQIYCSTHYLKSMLGLWGAAITAVLLATHFQSALLPFGRHYLKDIYKLADNWMSSLLGTQVTAIGIVFPLVVGLISVLFQKKSSRIHIQSAYQLHSGYMFSGLSGLSLAAFILIGGLVSSHGDKYLSSVFAVTAFIWMLFNIFLSVWFFITSLNVLDDKKRDRLMIKYFKSQLVNESIRESLISPWLTYPGHKIGEDRIKGIKILPYSTQEKDMTNSIWCRVKRGESVSDIYIRPMLFLLKKLRGKEGQAIQVVILPSFGNKDNERNVLSYSGTTPSWLWRQLFRCCFSRNRKEKRQYYEGITRDFFGEAYDALDDKNIGVFQNATKRLVNTYASIKNSFQYDGGNYLDGLNEAELGFSFSRAFQYDVSQFFRETVKTLETTGKYTEDAMQIPMSVYLQSEGKSLRDFSQFIESLAGTWHSLIEWKAGTASSLTPSQEKTHHELIISFIGQWEGWGMGLCIGSADNDDYGSRLLYHLHYTPTLLIDAVVADDEKSARQAHDLLCLWYKQVSFTRYWEEEFRWHSFFLTPDYLNYSSSGSMWEKLLRSCAYNSAAVVPLMASSALSDMRLLVSGYIVANINPQKNINLADVVTRLLESRPYEFRDIDDPISPAFRTATDVIDVLLRIEHGQSHKENRWYHSLSETVSKFVSLNRRPLISGRIYTESRQDVRSLYGAFALIAIKLAAQPESVTPRINEALADGLFMHQEKIQIVHILKRLKRDPTEPYNGFMLSSQEYATKVVNFNETIDNYILAFGKNMEHEIIAAKVDMELFKNTDRRLTDNFIKIISEDFLLARLSFSEESESDLNWTQHYLRYSIDKESVAKTLNPYLSRNYPSDSNIRTVLLSQLHDQLSTLPVGHTIPVENAERLLQEIRRITADNSPYVLVMYAAWYNDELRELLSQKEKHSGLGISVDPAVRGISVLPYRVNNTVLYQVRGSQLNYALLLSTAAFGEMKLFRYPDGTLFNTFYCEGDDPLKGVQTTLWETELQLTGSIIARFELL
ncbi:hypothetical protein [Enterobacter roggenkampii]|uniref:hypothetical protein n=1 Tax=Enterobacter roggenkampii TaxID=1812935 RepID=UPI00064A71B7|nr:hypothetical protein [Enterobacter roggenkampii]KLP31078.1 hypothetical protein YA48_09840 [Enterobacter roggenkampii]